LVVSKMKTIITSATNEVIISDQHPTVLIGERINPTGKKKFAESLKSGNLDFVIEESLNQVKLGADILDVNVGLTGINEVDILPQAVQMIMETVNVPLCIDSSNPKAIESALKVYKGKPLINSVNGEESSLKGLLPIIKEYGAAVIGLTMDDKGIPSNVDRRLGIALKIVEEADHLGIPREDIVIDCLAMTVGADNKAGLVTLEAIKRIKSELGVNLALGASNISFGLPDRNLINWAFLSIAIAAGANCPIMDVAKARPIVLAADLVLGRDKYAERYISHYRMQQNL